ncbi:MAG: agmatine deiminase family protein [Bacteroidetes bacterium]|nr:agmatine deiminase family protein [Bacteroidota bacterium]
MRKIITLSIFLLFACASFSQDLPHKITDNEKLQMPFYVNSIKSQNGTMGVNPPSSPVRTIGEWEELQGLLIAWTSYQSMLREIVRAAKQETRVYILSANPTSVINYLSAGGVDTVNVSVINIPFNSVWCRDYGPWSAYTNDVDTLITIDWIYNRPRPLDDAVPVGIAAQLGTPLYETTTSPNNLIHTGGNFMTDGFGTGFSSELITNENPTKTKSEIDTIMKKFMGITRYINFPVLPYDAIHHIDMHMKLLDEETLLVGQYPTGVADGPQIEANLTYITTNFNSVYGTPYNVVRIPMPDDNGAYPNTTGDYFTYTNSSFINKTLIVPTYNIPEDSVALQIYRDALPGYNVVGINSLSSIPALGALHCITKELGTDDPLLISHQRLRDTYNTTSPYLVIALMKHRTGIQNATLFWRADTTQPYQQVTMTPLIGQNNQFAGAIPPQAAGTNIYYYVQANAVSGKQQVRPLPAPQGYWKFKILGAVGLTESNDNVFELKNIYPNPCNAITCVPVNMSSEQDISVKIKDVAGRNVRQIYRGTTKAGINNFFFNASLLAKGTYIIEVVSEKNTAMQKIIVR